MKTNAVTAKATAINAKGTATLFVLVATVALLAILAAPAKADLKRTQDVGGLSEITTQMQELQTADHVWEALRDEDEGSEGTTFEGVMHVRPFLEIEVPGDVATTTTDAPPPPPDSTTTTTDAPPPPPDSTTTTTDAPPSAGGTTTIIVQPVQPVESVQPEQPEEEQMAQPEQPQDQEVAPSNAISFTVEDLVPYLIAGVAVILLAIVLLRRRDESHRN